MTDRPESHGAEAGLARRLRVVIVDDEPLSRRAMRQLVDARDDVEVLSEHESAVGLEAMLEQADVVFLDIEMPVRSGMDLARSLSPRASGAGPPFVIFVTAHDEYAVPAFDTSAIDYLTKPVAPARLARALERVHERLDALAPLSERLGGELEAVAAGPPASLVARIGAREVIVPLADVALLEADGVYTALHAGGRRYLVRRPLDELEQALGPADFLRVHRSYLVRRSAVAEIRPGRGGGLRELVLVSGEVVPISRRRQAAVVRRLRGDPPGSGVSPL